jgi:hypothetical protein
LPCVREKTRRNGDKAAQAAGRGNSAYCTDDSTCVLAQIVLANAGFSSTLVLTQYFGGLERGKCPLTSAADPAASRVRAAT